MRCRLRKKQQDCLLEFFVAEVTGRTAADLVGGQQEHGGLFLPPTPGDHRLATGRGVPGEFLLSLQIASFHRLVIPHRNDTIGAHA